VLNTWSKDVMKECNVMNPETVYDLEKTGFWGEVVRQKKDLILNDFEAPHSQKKGYPEGHVKLLRFMSIPIFKENEIIAVVGMANKDTDYTDDDVLKLRLMMDAVWKVVDHKKAEEDFRENEKRYHLIAENMGNIITMLDMDFNFTFATPNVEKVIGFTPEEYVNLSLAETLLPVSLQEVMTGFEEEMAIEMSGEGNPDRIRIFELEECKKDGSIFWMENVVSFVRDENGVPVGILSVSRDITERKEAEKEQEKLQEQLVMAQKMESVGRLAGGIAHDFNNMLSVIMGRIELLMLKVDKDHPFYKDFFQIKNAAERSANLTAQLLAFARKQVVVPRVIDLNDSLKSLLRMMKRLIGENIKLKLDLEENLWPVKIDPTQLDQVVANLTVNAKDAMSDKGVMRFTTKNILIESQSIENLPGLKKGEYVLFTVSDDGSGMSQDVLEKIFEPFFTTKKQGEGTGLGLSTIYGIVKQNNGYIYAFSEIGSGTEFRIYIPRCFNTVEKTVTENKVGNLNKKDKTILFVEDEMSILEIGSETLESFGYNVISAETPFKALQIVREIKGKIDLLITDVIMPEMNGRELEKAIKEIYPDIFVIMMSGYTSDIIAREGVVEENANFVQKPFSQKKLIETVEKVLSSK